jgi:hypothetical protein
MGSYRHWIAAGGTRVESSSSAATAFSVSGTRGSTGEPPSPVIVTFHRTGYPIVRTRSSTPKNGRGHFDQKLKCVTSSGRMLRVTRRGGPAGIYSTTPAASRAANHAENNAGMSVLRLALTPTAERRKFLTFHITIPIVPQWSDSMLHRTACRRLEFSLVRRNQVPLFSSWRRLPGGRPPVWGGVAVIRHSPCGVASPLPR